MDPQLSVFSCSRIPGQTSRNGEGGGIRCEVYGGRLMPSAFIRLVRPERSLLTAGGKRAIQRLELGFLEGVAAAHPQKKKTLITLSKLALRFLSIIHKRGEGY